MLVIARHDAYCTPLQCTYDGPVLSTWENFSKYFTLHISGQQDTVSVHCFKPEFLDVDFGPHEDIKPQPTTNQSTEAAHRPFIKQPETTLVVDDSSHRPLRIAGRSGGGQVTRLPAKLYNIVVLATGGGTSVCPTINLIIVLNCIHLLKVLE